MARHHPYLENLERRQDWQVHKTAPMRVEHNGQYAVVASKGGAPEHPFWYYNLVANPMVELQDGPQKRDYIAHQADGSERDEWWQRAVQAFPPYAVYEEPTDRMIQVFILTPIDG